MPAGTKNKSTVKRPLSRLFIILFCVAAAGYITFCAVAFTSADRNEQNSYITAAPVTYTESSLPAPEKKVNINTANRDELMEITGIGEVTADRIIEYRRRNGDFLSTEEIMNISGIGKSLYSRIKQCIEV